MDLLYYAHMLHIQSNSDSDESHKISAFFGAHTPFQAETDSILIHPDERPTTVFYLTSGIVAQTKTTIKGQELTMNLYKPGSFFPLMDFVAGIQNQYTFRTIETCTGFKAPVQEVVTWIQSDAAISFDITKRLLKGLHGMLLKTEKLMQRDATAILAQTLLTFAARFPTADAKTVGIALSLTHQQLADATGLSRETITRELSQLKADGVISNEHKQIIIHYLTLLQKNAENVREITVL